MAEQNSQTKTDDSSATQASSQSDEAISKMENLLKNSPEIFVPKLGELVEGSVIHIYRNQILVDLGGTATGIISGRETKDSLDTLKSLESGDKISAVVVEEEDPEGMIVLSLRKASQEKTWQKFVDSNEKGTIIEVKVNEANKGGLLLDVDGIQGFIPVSQLAPLHYPRVNGADAQKILERLQKLVGETFQVKAINIDREKGKLILSEKAAFDEQRQKSLGGLKVGQKVKGKISGLVNFGMFVAFTGLEGLVHISEIAWGHVNNPSEFGKLGDEVEVLVIGIEGDKISLSLKRLTQDPWIEAAKTFKLGTIVDGEVNRITQFGAFIKLNDEINGLIHLSEISHQPIKDISEKLKIGAKIKAKIITVDLDDHRIGLSIKALETPPPTVKTEEKVESKDNPAETAKKTTEKPAEATPEKATETDKPKETPPAEKIAPTDEAEEKNPAEKTSPDSDLKLADVKEINAKHQKTLIEAGYETLADLKKAKPADLTKLEGIGPKTAEKILELTKK